MYYINIGVGIFQFILLTFLIKLFISFKTQKKSFSRDHRDHSLKILKTIDSFSNEISDRIEDIRFELGQVEKDFCEIQQEKINWISIKKRLPDPNKLVIVLKNNSSKESRAFITDDKNSWKVLGTNGYEHSKIDDYLYWKPIYVNKTALTFK
jgi:hypothetical protein